MTKLVTVAHGRPPRPDVDARPNPATFGVVDDSGDTSRRVHPAGSRQWLPGAHRPTRSTPTASTASGHRPCPVDAFNPLDPVVADRWPLPFDSDDPRYLSSKDRDAPAPRRWPDEALRDRRRRLHRLELRAPGCSPTDDEITVFDKLTYAGNLDNIRDVLDDRR